MSFPKVLLLSLLISFSLKGFSQTLDTLIEVGTHGLHFNIIKGKGVPIVFESGAGNDGTVWDDLLIPKEEHINQQISGRNSDRDQSVGRVYEINRRMINTN